MPTSTPISVNATSMASSTGASASGLTAYALTKFLAGGTFTTGISLDWRTQFSSATLFSSYPCNAGEINVPGVQTTYGVYSAYAFTSVNPYTTTVLIAEAAVGTPTQLWVNGSLIVEATAPTAQDIDLIGGPNIIEIVRSCSPIVLVPSGSLFSPVGFLNPWVTLFPPGSDPYSSTSGSGGTAQSTTASTV